MSSITITSDLFRRVCGRFATGVCVLTAGGSDGAPYGLTVNSFTSLSLDPPLVMGAIARSSSQLPAFEQCEFFAVNILCEEQKDVSTLFAKRDADRFSKVEWRPGKTGAPVLDGSLGVIECRKTQVIDAGDHRVVIGEVLEASCCEGRPLLYFGSGYAALG